MPSASSFPQQVMPDEEHRAPIRCNLQTVEDIVGPATIDQLVADAADRGHQITARVIRDWTQAGLLDYPQKRSAGRGHGSRHALYSENQRHLLLTLLHHRPTNGISGLARIPVGIWVYWGEEYVELPQVRRAMRTWLGDARVSLRQSRATAREILGQIDNPAAGPAARKELLDTISDGAYTARVDLERLERAVQAVFEPGSGQIRRAVGHPAAPMTTRSMVDMVRARCAAAQRLIADEITDQEFLAARHTHLVGYAEYAMQRGTYTAMAPADHPDMYEPVTAEIALNSCCGHLLTTLGLNHLYPEAAARVLARPAPQMNFGS